jgi:hypothetical protein
MVMIWDEASDPFWGAELDLHMMTYQAQAEWTHRFNDRVKNEAKLGFGYWGGNNDEGVMAQKWNVLPLQVREEVSIGFGKRATLRLGLDSMFQWAIVKMKVPADYGGEGTQGLPWSADYFLTFEGTKFGFESGMYGELDLNVTDKIQTIFGIRGDYISQVERWGADPRFVVRYEMLPKTTLKGGIGMFHQQPDMAQGDEDYGNPHLKLSYAVHYSVGIEQQLLDNMELSLEGFFKDMYRLVRLSDNLRERFNNDGTGRVWGMEAQWKHNPTNRFFGWITYTLMKSERIDHSGDKPRPFDYDQTHILTAVGNVHIGWGVDAGLRFRLTSGNPYTPVIGASYDAAADGFVPAYGETNSKRMPLYHQLDLRIDKKWQWKYLAFTAYLDVQNVYFAKNTEFYVYSYNYRQRGTINGIPILPSIGLKLEY